jgi:superfamily II DNA or RNA helicase
MQSLVKGDEVKEYVRNYGMVIVDECHHVPAFSFEQILKNLTAKHVYGLTATPVRPDGHHPIIFLQCGPVRYKVDARKQAEKRPFEHYVIPRFTPFRKPVQQDEKEWSISEIYAEIATSQIRNQLIKEKDKSSLQEMVHSIKNSGVNIVFKTNIHQKFAVIDQRIVWYGSINLLSFGSAEESIMRLDSLNIANELIGSIDDQLLYQ